MQNNANISPREIQAAIKTKPTLHIHYPKVV